jgi:hypothetical protein
VNSYAALYLDQSESLFGRATVQTVSRCCPLRRMPGFGPGPDHVTFVADRGKIGKRFPPSNSVLLC